jgi:hypothetical protein
VIARLSTPGRKARAHRHREQERRSDKHGTIAGDSHGQSPALTVSVNKSDRRFEHRHSIPVQS